MLFTHDDHEICAGYLWQMFDPDQFQQLVDLTAKNILALRESVKFDLLAFRGRSGAAMAFPLSYKLGVPIWWVAKYDDAANHRRGHVGYSPEGKLALLLDDFVDTGETLRALDRAVTEAGGIVVGALEYLRESPLRWAPVSREDFGFPIIGNRGLDLL